MNLLLHNSELTIKTSNVGRGSIRNIQIFSAADVCFPVVGTTGIYSNLESQAGCGRVGCLRGVSVDALESEILSHKLQICSRHSKCWFFAALLHYILPSHQQPQMNCLLSNHCFSHQNLKAPPRHLSHWQCGCKWPLSLAEHRNLHHSGQSHYQRFWPLKNPNNSVHEHSESVISKPNYQHPQ